MLRRFIKFLVPVFVIKILNIILKRNILFIGNYQSWHDAFVNSKGYNDYKIFKKKKESFQKVLIRKAEYERDSVLFYKEKVDNPLIEVIERIRFKLKKKINVLDFGGSFASIYFQNKSILKNKYNYSWSVIDQKKIIKYAKSKKIKKKIKELYSNLNFYYSIKNFYKFQNSDLVLFSGVLQYLENPYQILQYLVKKKVEYILILRTSFNNQKEQIKVQIVPESIYKSSYPIRIFNKKQFLSFFKKNEYQQIKTNFKDYLISNIAHENMLFKRK
jgi:putative methyltransferase (TIGR04325 family)